MYLLQQIGIDHDKSILDRLSQINEDLVEYLKWLLNFKWRIF